MIYITGDTHIPIDISKLNTTNFPQQKLLDKDDYVIICGDFGGVWDNSKEELFWRKWLLEKNFTTIFCDGNHENFDLLNKFPVEEWNGGKVHFINDSVIHLMRGQVFTIDNLKFFTMGGATSIDKHKRIEGKSWWKEEIPNKKEYDEAMDNLDKYDWCVDYVITHDVPKNILKDIYNYNINIDPINNFFQIIYDNAQFKKWFSGHHHIDKTIDKCTIIYDEIIKIS